MLRSPLLLSGLGKSQLLWGTSTRNQVHTFPPCSSPSESWRCNRSEKAGDRVLAACLGGSCLFQQRQCNDPGKPRMSLSPPSPASSCCCLELVIHSAPFELPLTLNREHRPPCRPLLPQTSHQATTFSSEELSEAFLVVYSSCAHIWVECLGHSMPPCLQSQPQPVSVLVTCTIESGSAHISFGRPIHLAAGQAHSFYCHLVVRG